MIQNKSALQSIEFLPLTFSGFHDQSKVLNGNDLLVLVQNYQMYGFEASQQPAQNGDSFQQTFELAAGNYDFNVLGIVGVDKALVDFYIDNVLIGSIDWYNSSNIYNTKKILPAIAISDGQHVLKAVVNGKNASSTGYKLNLTKFWFCRV
jgi:hypothetical protein